MSHHDLSRANTFVTNTVLCRPVDNRNPTPREIACCSDRLKVEIKTREPTHILALGNFAAGAILGRTVKITSERVGPPKSSDLYPGVKVIPAFHPAYCLRAADNFPALVTDIGKIKLGDNLVNVRWEPPRFAVFDEAAAARQALRELLNKYNTYVIDIETGLDKDVQFDHPDHYQLLCIGICYDAGRAIVIGRTALQDRRVRDLCREVLHKPTSRIIAHNGKFDLAGLWKIGHGRLWFDTMLASYCLDERPGTHSLGYLGVEVVGSPNWKSMMDKYSDNYASAPPDVLYKYNAYDVANTWDLYKVQEAQLAKEGLRELHDFLCEASDQLMLSEMEGVQVDLAYLDFLTDHYLEGLEDLEGQLAKWVMNPRSPKQVKEALHELGFSVGDTTADTLQLMFEQPRFAAAHPFIELMLRHRKEQKLYGTYVKGIRKRLYKGRVYPTFLLHGTTTGRLACRNPNLQNIPRESSIRRQFVPGPGNVFVQGDYATIELRVIATLARDAYLQEVFSDASRDIHNEVATRFFGPNFTKDQRVRAKAVVYGLSYGREAFSLAQEYRWSVAEADRYIKDFFKLIPGVVAWKKQVKNTVLHEHQDLVSPFGRHRRFWLITAENRHDVVKESMAFLPQSTASDLTLSSLIRLRRDHGLHIRIPVHDSLLAECPADQADDVAHLMQTVMQDTAEEIMHEKTGESFVKFPVDVRTGANWGEV